MPLGRQVPQARERPGGHGSLKILLDEDTGKVFAQRLTELLEPEGATVFRSVKVGWRGAKNGDLLTMAANNGYTHLVTADKMMAEETPTTIPVLVVDQMDDASTDRICRTARTVALLLFQNALENGGVLRGVCGRVRTVKTA